MLVTSTYRETAKQCLGSRQADIGQRCSRCPPAASWTPSHLVFLLVFRVGVAEPDRHADLEVRDLSVFNMAADFSDLKPGQIANGLRYLLHAVADCLIDAVGGGAYDLGNSVRLI